VPELTVSVDVAIPPELRVRLAGLTDAVNPVPAETERETVPEKPPMLAAVMVDVPEEPATTLRVVALDARVKSDDCETDSVRETECERLPLLPVTMIVYEPGVVDPDVVIDRVDAAEPPEDKVRLELLNETTGGLLVAGEIPSVNVTVPVKPFRLVTVMVELELAPRCRVNEFGFAPIEKSAAELTDTWTVVECDKDPLVPVVVTV
jgi:hypothetical protein